MQRNLIPQNQSRVQKTNVDFIKVRSPKFFFAAIPLLLIVFVVLYNIFASLSSSINQKLWKVERDKLSRESNLNYEKLSEKQSNEAKSDVEKKSSSRSSKKKLEGTQKVQVVLVKPAGISNASLQPLLSKIRDTDAKQIHSLWYINTYLQEQAKFYTPKAFSVEFIFSEIFTSNDITTIGDIANPWEKDAFGATKLQDDFEKILTANNLDQTNPVIFLFFDPFNFETATESRFYDNQKFRSFADDQTSRVYVNVYSLSPSFAPRVTEIVAHELLHLYGANDKYLEGKMGCADDGWEQLPFPYNVSAQNSADIMCGFTKDKDDYISFADFESGEVILNWVTAQEIGW